MKQLRYVQAFGGVSDGERGDRGVHFCPLPVALPVKMGTEPERVKLLGAGLCV